MDNLKELRTDIAKRSKKGLHFIAASVAIWLAVFVVWVMPIDNVLTKNLFTFCATALLFPLSYIIAKVIGAEFSIKDNPLSQLGLLFSFNQFLYILIAMWVYPTVPEKMVMVLAMIFGAHLMPFGWLYESRAYLIMSVVVSLAALTVGIAASPVAVSLTMVMLEIIFSIWLVGENHALNTVKTSNA